MAALPHSLTTNRRVAPLGIDDPTPEFAWKLDGTSAQVGYKIEVATDSSFGEDSLIWSSGDVVAAEPFGAPYAGPLTSRTRYSWRVRVRLQDATTEWSAPAEFETGVLHTSEWAAQWVTAPATRKNDRRALYFRTIAELPAAVVRGRAYASALGWYRLIVNNIDLTGHSLVPRWTPFHKFIEYQTYDVTDAFTAGTNTIGIVVADGRYRGRLGVMSKGARYGDRLGAFLQVELDLADGSHATLTTDGTWKVGTGRIRRSDPKFGERADLRVDDRHWLTPQGAPLDQTDVEILPTLAGQLIAEQVERVTDIGRLPGSVGRSPAGVQLIDFGQNFAGVARVRLPAGRGKLVRLTYSEVLMPNGELDTGYLDMKETKPEEWFQFDEVKLGSEPVDYTPWFTIHGFRYVAVEGLDTALSDDDVEGIVLSTALRETADFHASDPRLEQLWRNVQWSMRSNFTDTASDCPTRERSGWTGDVQVFGPTASQMADVDSFYRRYLRNAEADQYDDGRLPVVIPAEDSPGHGRNLLRFASASVGWGDVLVLLPWTLYTYYGDTQVLERQYDSAQRWVDHLARRAANKRGLIRRYGKRVGRKEKYIVDTGYHFGEWLRPGEPAGATITDNILGQPVVATAYLAHSATVLAKIARVIGKIDDANRYENLAEQVRGAWREAFVRDGGAQIGADKQDEYVRALAYDLLLPAQRPRAAARLVELIQQAGYHLGTGFLSTPMLLSTLVDVGRADVALRILMQTDVPSWLGQIAHGATTTWETWEGYRPNGRALMSHNHYAFGSVVSFLQEQLAGLAPAEPGYRKIRVAPIIGAGITAASTSVETPYGTASSAWTLDGGELELTVQIPAGTTADISIGEVNTTVTAGTHEFTTPLPHPTTAPAPELTARKARS